MLSASPRMLPIATLHKACGEKEQGFVQENTTSIKAVQKRLSVEIVCLNWERSSTEEYQ